ncbi:basic secretory family protein [Luteolibacter flavescens]|uniref:Basic secretory family protein n=1 Tax=Luteolibacter flavescens TaxID=1859460 RepID=A0ABT3FS85_9BACT|nr:basic secretory family protein [Luteolibacter flavescens]MCW1886169.1 basic secretory family protein [Luteolibacter flavescens]
MKFRPLILLPLAAAPLLADVPEAKVETGHSASDAGFKFDSILPPATNDAATGAKFTVVSGTMDPNSGGLAVLNDGKIPSGDDEPRANFFFAGQGGRLALDLGKDVDIASLATYSWHSGERSAQNYKLYAAAGDAKAPAAGEDPATVGWVEVATVQTPADRTGQHGVTISSKKEGALGKYRHLLFDIKPNQDPRGFGNTFFSEIDVVEAGGPELTRYKAPEKQLTTFETEGGEFKIILDSTASPDLLPWFKEKAIPALQEWYPKVAHLIVIPGKTPEAPKTFRIELREGQIIPGRDGIPGYASGEQIVVSSKFMRDQKDGEALGCLIHEMVHIVQFGSGKRAARGVPVWFFEGATDYIRWYLFEPERNGTVIRNPDAVKYDDSYRTTANFMEWVMRTYTKDLIQKAHIAIHEGYSKDLWQTWTGKPVEELEKEWKEDLRKRLEKK